MPRDGSGNYTLPAIINPVVAGTVIADTWANPTLSDIAVQLNNVLTRDGLLGPVTAFKIIDGTEPLPGLSFASQAGTGWWRDAVQMGFSYQGSAVFKANGSGVVFGVGKRVTLTDAPVAGTDAANKAYVDSVAAGGVAVSSGTYTPTITAVDNCTLASTQPAQWMRVGNVITVAGTCFISVTLAGSSTSFRMSLPVASNFASKNQCGGVASNYVGGSSDDTFGASADFTNDQVVFGATPPNGGPNNLSYTYTYSVV